MTISDSEIGTLRIIDIDEEMRGAYLDYAMSVIVSRALPDVRDGLKPVHRRILFAMHSMGLRHDKPHRKSARIVGEVLGKFHPHSDDAVYDAMVRLAQDFSMRYPLVDGQGNFGSIDGDNAAAMRYTEARLAEIASTMLADIDKDTIDFAPNFDESLVEPTVLPASLPNLLVNGSSGIAVGMATNIPPHNLGEVVEALVFIIDHYHVAEDITLEHLMHFVKGPDFPTGGIVYRYREGKDGHEDIIAKAYASGRGRLLVQAKVHVEAMSRNRSRLVITELPYQTNKTRLIERIAEMARDGKIEGITDLRDESDRQGMRIVIELTRNVDPKATLEMLYKLTPMQQTFGVNVLALVDGEPRLLSLKRVLMLYLDHRREIIRRRSEYELARARDRAHILEGLLIALAHLDEVIATIRRSPDTETARGRLMRKFKLSEVQAQAILDMPLKRLSRLEREKLQSEHKELLKRIKYLEDLLAHPEKMLGVIREELLELKEKYSDARRTQIVDVQGTALTTGELLPDEEVLVMLTKKGNFFRQSLAGRRRGSLPRKVADAPIAMAAAPARDSVFLFTAAGQAVQKRIHQIPTEEGTHFSEITDLQNDDEIVCMLPLPAPDEEGGNGEEKSIFLVTKEGRCKRIAVSELWANAHTSPIVINVEDGDALVAALFIDSADDILLITRLGQSIRFGQEDVRIMGLSAAGVLAMKLSGGDQIAGAGICKPGHEVVILTTRGYGLRTTVNKYPKQKRYGSGVVAMKLTQNHGAVETAAIVNDEPEMFVVFSKGPMRVFRLEDAPRTNRAARGRRISGLQDGDVRRLLALVIPKVRDGNGSPPQPPPPPPLPSKRARRGGDARKKTERTKAAAPAKASKARSSASPQTRKSAASKKATPAPTPKKETPTRFARTAQTSPARTARKSETAKSAPKQSAAASSTTAKKSTAKSAAAKQSPTAKRAASAAPAPARAAKTTATKKSAAKSAAAKAAASPATSKAKPPKSSATAKKKPAPPAAAKRRSSASASAKKRSSAGTKSAAKPKTKAAKPGSLASIKKSVSKKRKG